MINSKSSVKVEAGAQRLPQDTQQLQGCLRPYASATITAVRGALQDPKWSEDKLRFSLFRLACVQHLSFQSPFTDVTAPEF